MQEGDRRPDDGEDHADGKKDDRKPESRGCVEGRPEQSEEIEHIKGGPGGRLPFERHREPREPEGNEAEDSSDDPQDVNPDGEPPPGNDSDPVSM